MRLCWYIGFGGDVVVRRYGVYSRVGWVEEWRECSRSSGFNFVDLGFE